MADSEALLKAKRYPAAYYLAGYAVECALKACIAKTFRANTIPDLKRVQRVWTHKLDDLVGLAGLGDALEKEKDVEFRSYWNTIKDWEPERRYLANVRRKDAQDFHRAIADPHHGVLQWLQQHW